MNPIDYPEVVLDGTTFVFKRSLAAARFAAKHGITGQLPSQDDPGYAAAVLRSNAEAVAIFAHKRNADGLLVHAGIPPDVIEAMIDPNDIPALSEAIKEAAEKAMPAAKPLVLPAAS